MPPLQTAHHQSLTINLPSIPFISPPTSTATGNTLKFTFPLHSSTTDPDNVTNTLLSSLPTLSSTTVPATHTILTIPPGSTFSTGLHWHETHDEYLLVLQGTARMTIDTVTRLVGPEDGVQEIPRGVVHGFQRGDIAAATPTEPDPRSQLNEDLIMLEFTSPVDPYKEVLFRNGVSAFLANDSRLSLSLIPQLLVIMGTLDQYPLVIPASVPGSKLLSWGIVHAVFGCCVPVMKWCGWRGWEKEWTPRELWTVASGGTEVGAHLGGGY